MTPPWMRQMNHLGVRFVLQGATVVAIGDGVSPALQAHIATPERQQILLNLLAEQVNRMPVPSAPKPVTVEVTDGDRLIWQGIQNARKAEQRKAAIASKVRR